MKIKINELDIADAEKLQHTYRLSSLCAKTLASKQLSEEQIKEILSPPLLQNPLKAKGMKDVIERILLAKERKEKVLVCGDYDADGICATAILYETLGRMGIAAGFYIPNRFKEGYGLHPDTVVMAHEKGYSLMITVDNGVKAFAAIQKAQELQMDLIISDHHTMDDTSLNCLYLLHPSLMGDEFQYLCGAGVALEISRALIGDHKEYIVLACVASIGDMMPMWKETRAIVRLGIQYLKEGTQKAVQLLANTANPAWDETLIAFQIVPKLNATGRLADQANANNTVRYLLTRNPEHLKVVAKQINKLNETRKTMSDEMSIFARTLVNEDAFQILFHESFHEGLVGLVAGKLSNELQKPVMILSKQEDGLKGSIRSYGGLDLTTFFDDFKELTAYGGHKAAAGISVKEEHLDALIAYVQEKMNHITLQEHQSYDVITVAGEELSIQAVEQLNQLKPFGQEFSEPLFQVHDLHILSCKELSNHLHVKWETKEQIDCMKFHALDEFIHFKDREQLSFVGSLHINSFRYVKKVNLFLDCVLS